MHGRRCFDRARQMFGRWIHRLADAVEGDAAVSGPVAVEWSPFTQGEVPDHVFRIPELDFSEELSAKPLNDVWFIAGAWTVTPRRDERGVEDVVSHQSLLARPGALAEISDRLDAVGNKLDGLGAAGGWTGHSGGETTYQYSAFHDFDFGGPAEPLAFVTEYEGGSRIELNPDLPIFFGLYERPLGSGSWWDPRRSVEVVRRQYHHDGNLERIEVRTAYLLRYLKARQRSLIVGRYRHLHLHQPAPEAVDTFHKEDVSTLSADGRAKVVFNNWGLRADVSFGSRFLQRRMHLWFEIPPPTIDLDDPWHDEPSFDATAMTFPTRKGEVAPARFRSAFQRKEVTFAGTTCDFMSRIYFRQEVLTKYEATAGFEVADNGSVHCGHHWALSRSTDRLGNELLSTGIGDFAEGVPLEEWPHWKQFSAPYPSTAAVKLLREQRTIPEAMRQLDSALTGLNGACGSTQMALGLGGVELLWKGSLESIAGRQLRWVYPSGAGDEEFLKRATLLSTFVIDELHPPIMRTILSALDPKAAKKGGTTLGSRKLLERLVLLATIGTAVDPAPDEVLDLLKIAEGGKPGKVGDKDLTIELAGYHEKVRHDLRALAFLYDLRTHGGLAHPGSPEKAADAAEQLGLPREKWHRDHYMSLLHLVTESVRSASASVKAAVEWFSSAGSGS